MKGKSIRSVLSTSTLFLTVLGSLSVTEHSPSISTLNNTVKKEVGDSVDDSINISKDSSEDDNFVMPASSFSQDAFYILSATDQYNYKMSDFETGRFPCYYAFDYSDVKPGDVIIEFGDSFISSMTGHAAMVYDIAYTYNGYKFIRTIEAVAGGVQFGYYDDKRINDYNACLYRPVDATDAQINKARYFMYQQLGKPYSWKFTTQDLSIDTEEWFCSELVNAAYNYAGYGLGDFTRIWPGDLQESDKLEIYYLPIVRYIYISLRGWTYESGWSVKVQNLGTESLTVSYSPKMCFESTAINWDFEETETITLASGESETVGVANNDVAVGLAFSFLGVGYRYLTYVTNIDRSIYTFNRYDYILVS